MLKRAKKIVENELYTEFKTKLKKENIKYNSEDEEIFMN